MAARRHVAARRRVRIAVDDRRRVMHDRRRIAAPHRYSSWRTQQKRERRLAAATIAAAVRRRTGRPDIVLRSLVTNAPKKPCIAARIAREPSAAALHRCPRRGATAGGSNGGYSVTGAVKLDSIDHSRWKLVDARTHALRLDLVAADSAARARSPGNSRANPRAPRTSTGPSIDDFAVAGPRETPVALDHRAIDDRRRSS